jgi:hypothetical protein
MDEMINPRNGWYKNFEHMAAHGLAKSRKQAVAKDNQSHAKKKRELKDNDRSFQLKKTQQIFNEYIRRRDRANSCISCCRFHTGQYHAGHYRTVGANPELRFNDRNCHKQCSACNNHLSGNIVNYRITLIRRFGVQFVEYLEGPHEPKRYTIENLKTLQKWFKRKIKRMERDND